MELHNFTLKTVNALTECYGEEAEIKTHEVYKNNGILLQGICALEKGKNIAPTIYMNSFFERYQNGENYGELVQEMIRIIEENRVTSNFDMEFFVNYETVKKKMVLRLINLKNNHELLKQVPYRKFYDLALVCHCLVVSEEIGMGAILIRKEHLDLWKIEEETLFKDALHNSPRVEPYSILKMSDIMKKMLQNVIEEQVDEICGQFAYDKERLLNSTLENLVKDIEERHLPMYVLTNEKRYYGAACLVYPQMLEIIAEKLQDDFFVIPSSVHEVIFVAKSECTDSFCLNEIIEEINKIQVEDEEILSNHTYFYQRKTCKLISVTNH